MKINEINIGDTVEDIRSGFEFTVVGIYGYLSDLESSKGTLTLDFPNNEGDVWEAEIEEVRLVRKWNEKE